jgi:hypothetical protein
MGIRPLRRYMIELPADERAAVEAWADANRDNRRCLTVIEPPAATWPFLTYLCDHLGFLAHGSNQGDLEELVPIAVERGDLTDFGNATQVFATPDALWAGWFALLNPQMTFGPGTANSCTRTRGANGRVAKEYWFAVSHENLLHDRPLTPGTVYLLRSTSFTDRNGEEWGSPRAVTPIAKVAVTPTDWPYAHAILGYDRRRLDTLLKRSSEGFPWFDDADLWRIVPNAYLTR